jgi:hypothetical protein
MTTESQVKLERYSTIEKEADAFGRVIGVRRLKPSEQTKVAGMCAELVGSDEVDEYKDQIDDEGNPILDEAGNPVKVLTGNKALIPHRTPLLIACSVCMIDDARIPFPKNRGELDAIYDRLDVEGLTAAGIAVSRLAKAEMSPKDRADAAKN